MINLNKIFYCLILMCVTFHFACASPQVEFNDELMEIIKQSFKQQFHPKEFTENELDITPINFDEEDAGNTLALFKATYKSAEKIDVYFIKFHGKLAPATILEDLEAVKSYFSSKQLFHVTVVHDLWSGVVDNYKFSVFPFIDAPTLDDILDTYLSEKNLDLVQSSQKIISIFENLGGAIGELHKSGLLKKNDPTSENFLSYSIRGDLHGGNILCHPSKGIFIIDNGEYVHHINKPAPLAIDLDTIFLQATRLPMSFAEEFVIEDRIKKGLQEDVLKWNLAFCKEYIRAFSENNSSIKNYLSQYVEGFLKHLFSKKQEIFSTQQYKLYDASLCEIRIQDFITKIQNL